MNYKYIHKFATILEWTGISVGALLITITDIAEAWWFFCGGILFLTGTIIKILKYTNKKDD